MARDYQRMGIRELREHARSTHPEHDPEAPRAFVDRILDMEAERVTWHWHENQGYQPFSSAAKMGEQPGGGTSAADPLAIAYDRGMRVHAGHEFAKQWLESARLRPRARLAVLIRAAKLYPMAAQQQALWAKSYDFIAQHLPIYSRMLQMGSLSTMGAIASVVVEEDKTGKPRRTPNPEPSEPIFKNGMAVKNAAREARVQLLLLAQI
ncbi:hypothetical protein [Vreelandella boliviensis]|uniref:hypothetical protein n=1 Tax=Vreelandella boliviensis TaxID=223527 RepID=UPI001B8C2638|nr:hypothetical protein [Halomonas boliviensis]MBS3670180.1 hypothetical protein [Halomonas boliviensis]